MGREMGHKTRRTLTHIRLQNRKGIGTPAYRQHLREGRRTSFQQTLGIPMGTDCAPFLANLYLYALESEWMSKKIERKEWKELQFWKHCFRYIDDLVVFNNDGMMERVYGEIYGELRLKKESQKDGLAAHFLEVDMIIEDGFIHTGLYDKRDDFGFRVVTFPSFPSNTPVPSAHGLLIAQLVRFATVCDKLETFHERASMLTKKLIDQGFITSLLEKKCRVFYERNGKLLLKYLCTEDRIVKGCMPVGIVPEEAR
jgi:hypothetical protein